MARLNDTEAIERHPMPLAPEQIWRERKIDSKTGDCRQAGGRFGSRSETGCGPEGLRGACEGLK